MSLMQMIGAIAALAFAMYEMWGAVLAAIWSRPAFRSDCFPQLPVGWHASRLFRLWSAALPALNVAAAVFWGAVAFALICRISKTAMALA